MIENFNGIFFLVLYILVLLGNIYYAYSTLFNTKKWLEIKAPFKNFKKSNFYQPKKLTNQNIKSIGLVAAFDNFYADVCLAEIGFY